MSTLKLKGSTSGYVELTAPATAGNNTITLPTTAGTVVVANTSGNVNISGIITATTFSGSGSGLTGVGKVLQVVQGSSATSTAHNTTSYTDTTLSASITPSSASNKVLVIVSQTGHVYSSQTSNRFGSLQLVRNSTTIHTITQSLGNRGGLSVGSDISVSASVSLTYLDSPSTTSSVTYKTQAKINNADSNYTTQIDSSNSVITLLEIAG
jgi:hypothetical protein